MVLVTRRRYAEVVGFRVSVVGLARLAPVPKQTQLAVPSVTVAAALRNAAFARPGNHAVVGAFQTNVARERACRKAARPPGRSAVQSVTDAEVCSIAAAVRRRKLAAELGSPTIAMWEAAYR